MAQYINSRFQSRGLVLIISFEVWSSEADDPLTRAYDLAFAENFDARLQGTFC